MKLSDEQLSRVLTAHARGRLKRGGSYWKALPACLIQSAFVVESIADYTVPGELDSSAEAHWFDDNYQPTWTVDEFLAQLAARGLA